ncbi:hypothetical protein ACQFYA_21000 [Promicromonospora sp. Marseille-Q5078]
MDEASGFCLIWADDGGGGDSGGGGGESGGGDSGGGGGDSGGGDSGGGGGIGIELPGIDKACIYIGLAKPQPPKSDPVWKGHDDGAIHACNVMWGTAGAPGGVGGGPTTTYFFWAAEPPDAPPPPDPEDLARKAIAAMGLHAIDIGIVPEDAADSVGLVGLPTWMWAENPDGASMGPITRTASAGGFTVTATAKVDKVVWDMGDGTTVTCEGPGTPYADQYGKKSSPDCGHTYTRQGEYTVTATSYWTIEWAGIGETGAIPLDFNNSTTIRMGESQVITQ